MPRKQGLRKYLTRDVDGRGNVRWYVRVPGCHKIRLHAAPGEEGFDEAYSSAVTVALDLAPRPWSSRPAAQAEDPHRPGFVYFIRYGGRVKIGFATVLGNRLSSLQTGMAGEISTIVAVYADQKTEKRIHWTLAKSRVRGEWFRETPELIGLMRGIATSGREGLLDYFAGRMSNGRSQVRSHDGKFASLPKG